MIILVLLITKTYSQPFDTACGAKPATFYQQILGEPTPSSPVTSGLGSTAAATTDYIQFQPKLSTDTTKFLFDGLDTFQISLWFRPLLKHTNPSDATETIKPEQALFRLSMDTSDDSLITNQGVRVGMYYTADYTQTTQFVIRYGKTSTPYVMSNSPFPYLEEKWCWGSVGISYSKGKVSYYAFQPSQPSISVNPQPTTETINFHTPITGDAVMQLFYWGTSYVYHYGDIKSISILTGYIELDYKHNWFHLLFMDASYSVTLQARYRLEEMTGQVVYNKLDMTINGYLGTDNTVEAKDPTWGSSIGYLQFASTQQVKLPGVIFGSTNTIFGIALWFKVNVVLSGDADPADLTKDLQVFRKYYQGTTEVLTLLFYSTTAVQYGTKLKIVNTLFTPPLIVHNSNVWHHITVSILYPISIQEQSSIIYDITLEKGVYQAHQTTTLSNTYQESITDTIILGSPLNSFSSGNLQLSNVNFFNKYSVYVDEDGTDTNYLNCNGDCQVSLNSMSSQFCFICKSPLLMNEGNCVASCTTGANALSNTAGTVDLCRSCDFKCSSCNSLNACSSCNTGYFLVQPAANSCVTSANCGGTYVGDPTTSLCTKCGNGKREAGETCDEGNLVATPITTHGPGCINCAVNSPTYKCSGGTPTTKDTCNLACGDGVWDSGEICDDHNNVDGDGCSGDCSSIEDLYSCTPVGAPTSCELNCGNGLLESSSPDLEECDIGTTAQSGCSNCKIDLGYECPISTLTPFSKIQPYSKCNLLCGNGIINAGEDCDDKNLINNDGCSDCVTDQGWICSGAPSVCNKLCGNGVRDDTEECDDGNSVNNDGCTNCKVDTDYICTGGSLTSQDKCKAIPDVCGDGIKKSTEECDDGNTVSGDGCSKQCKIEIGYNCSGLQCTSICGDGIKINTEDCDDGNVLSGDGCNQNCKIENLYKCQGGSNAGKDSCILTCGDGIRNINEQCDDNNLDDGDGCSQYCTIESGYGCIIQTQSHDICFKCINNCAICTTTNTCDTCYTNFYQLEQYCYPGCPFGYYPKNNQCLQCSDNCSQCINSLKCMRCNYDHYLSNSKCYQHCPIGYYDQPNAMLGNQCIQCKSPCYNCDQNTCYSCIDKYYLDQETQTCTLCNMGDQCLKCDSQDGNCLLCSDGYYRDGNTCTQIPFLCGDGLHHPTERCDDGNITPLDGCDQLCKIELNWDCILYDPQGPDVCFELAPPEITYSWSKVYMNIIYVHFSRPMKEGIDFSSYINIIIPDLESLKFKEYDEVNEEGVIIQHDKNNAFIPYEYTVSSFSNQTIEITFSYQLTIQNEQANITFNNASLIQDIYNWSLVNVTSQSRRILQDISNETFEIQIDLPYYIYYESGEKQISQAVGFLLLIICIIGLLSGFYYYYRIGEGRIRKTIEFVQIISVLRYVDCRMGYNLEQIFTILNYFNLTFIPNIFDLFENNCNQFDVPPKFQYYDYNTQMLSEGGGRFLTALAALFVILGINECFYRFVPNPDVEYYTEQVHKYFRCQGLTIFLEIFFMDLVLSIILNLTYPDTTNNFGIINFLISLLFALAIIALMVVVVVKLIRNPHIIRVKSVYDYFGEFFDGLLFTTSVTKFFALVPYIQKILIAIILIILPFYYQVGFLVLLRLFFYSFSTNLIPIYFLELFIKDVAYDLSITLITLIMLAYQEDSTTKQQKLDTGWGVASIVVVTMGLQVFFVRYAISIIDRMIPPIMPDHEEIVQQDQDYGNQDIHILQQQVQIEKMENEFYGNK